MGGSRVQPSVIELGVGILFLHCGEKFLPALFVQLFELARDQVQGFPEDIALVVCQGHVMGVRKGSTQHGATVEILREYLKYRTTFER